MTERTIEEKIRRAKYLERVLADPIFQEAMEEARLSLIAEWERSKTPMDRERVHSTLTGLKTVLLGMQKVVDAGKHAQIELDRAQRQPV